VTVVVVVVVTVVASVCRSVTVAESPPPPPHAANVKVIAKTDPAETKEAKVLRIGFFINQPLFNDEFFTVIIM
jgi:hypothetical protein